MCRKIITFIVVLLCAFTSIKAHSVQYLKEDSLVVVNLLEEAQEKKLQTTADCQLFFARKLLGIPYVASTLEINKKEKLVVNLRQLDCTTFVENVTALTLCHRKRKNTFTDFCLQLQILRYRDGKNTGYQSRLHYFTDWIEDNSRLGICNEIHSPVPPFSETQVINVNYMTTHSERYPMLKGNEKMISAIAQMEKALSSKKYKYIPRKHIRNTKVLRKTVKDGDIIAIITNKKGLDTQHIGIAVWHADGLHLLNASSIHKKVVEEPMLLNRYLLKHPTMPGIRVVRLCN